MARGAQRPSTRRRKGKGGGRPSELTDEKRKTIVNALRTSLCSLEDAGWLAGISPRTITRWRKEGESDDGLGRDTPERTFWRETETALAEGRFLLAGRAFKNTAWDARLALTILERRDPKNWGAKQTVDVKLPTPPAASPRDRIMDRLDAIEARIRQAESAGVVPADSVSTKPPNA